MNLIDAIESEFASITTGMRSSADDSIQIVHFDQSTSEPSVQFASTLGLNKKLLKTANGKTLRIELFMEFANSLSPNAAASALDYCVSLLDAGAVSAPSRGSFIVLKPPQKDFWPSFDCHGLYFTLPALRTDGFHSAFRQFEIVPIWVVPLTESEVEILEVSGWEALEDRWEADHKQMHKFPDK